MKLPVFLVDHDNEIRLVGSRIGLAHVVRAYSNGESAEIIALRFPTLPLAQVHKALGYYLENKSEIDEYVQRIDAELARQRHSCPAPSTAELQTRLAVNSPLARGA